MEIDREESPSLGIMSLLADWETHLQSARSSDVALTCLPIPLAPWYGLSMLSTDLETMALGLPGTRESSHFGKRDFRVGDKIFMSLPEAGRAVCKLTPDQQRMMLETEPGLCAAVPGGWGLKGWTSVYFEGAERDVIQHILRTAWRNVAPKILVSGAVPPPPVQTKSSAV